MRQSALVCHVHNNLFFIVGPMTYGRTVSYALDHPIRLGQISTRSPGKTVNFLSDQRRNLERKERMKNTFSESVELAKIRLKVVTVVGLVLLALTNHLPAIAVIVALLKGWRIW
jgi:hypothetical protein